VSLGTELLVDVEISVHDLLELLHLLLGIRLLRRVQLGRRLVLLRLGQYCLDLTLGEVREVLLQVSLGVLILVEADRLRIVVAEGHHSASALEVLACPREF